MQRIRSLPLTIAIMHFITLATALIASATSALAGPIVQRNIGGIRVCTGANFTGDCWYGVEPLNSCISLNSLYVPQFLDKQVRRMLIQIA